MDSQGCKAFSQELPALPCVCWVCVSPCKPGAWRCLTSEVSCIPLRLMLALWSLFLNPSRAWFIAPVSIYHIFLQFCSLFFLLSSRSTVRIQITHSLVIIQLSSISCFISSPLSWLSPSALYFYLTYLLASSLYHAKAISQPLPIFFLPKSLRHHLLVTKKPKNTTVQIPQSAYFHHCLQQTRQNYTAPWTCPASPSPVC